MKALFTLLLLAVGFSGVAQRSSSKEITTDGRQLRIRVDIEQPGRSVHYNRSFDVADMDESDVKELEHRIIDSLDQALSVKRRVVVVNRKRDVWTKKQPCDDEVAYANAASEYATLASARAGEPTDPAETKDTASLSPSDVAPSSVLFREDKENGRLWMQYVFQKDGEELVVERTANVVGKTEREKQAIIKETERSLGIKSANQ
ncbi:hypothetical protein ACFSUS_10385 [Spirosoma soli]|uniref:DUF4136 domain-containing protein n=1 Tax=Spirosoma soli TaxID=1770529 RepID=A0ABW5M5T6_9BACT